MPYSHSVAIPVAVAVLTWWIIEKEFGKAALGRAVALAIVSHLVLDLATHAHDIVLWPGRSNPKLGLGLYEAAPLAAFVIEFFYGIFCWYSYRGGVALFALISRSLTYVDSVSQPTVQNLLDAPQLARARDA